MNSMDYLSAASRQINILVAYYSRFGVLKVMAEHIAQGAQAAPNVDLTYLEVEELPVSQQRPGETEADMHRRRAVILDRLTGADALIVGAPAYFGTLASPVKRLFEDCLVAGVGGGLDDRSRPWRASQLRDKVGAAFTASGTPHGGNEAALHSILTLFMHLGMVIVTPGQGEPILENPAAPLGATAIAGASGDRRPSPSEQAHARALGERVARITSWLRLGRTAYEQEHASRTSGMPGSDLKRPT
jgi:NAD(P)H dehydrogenase (quinone)